MGGCDTVDGVKQAWKLASFIAGGADKLKERPFVSVITNPISPLIVDSETLAILKFCAVNGIPVTCAPAPIAGATAPITLAGTLCQMHAEALAGAALTQLFAPGAKVLYGAVPSTMDLRHMDHAMGSVEVSMMNASAVRLAHYRHLPIYASAGVTEAKTPDIQAGCEKSFSNLLVAINGADLIHLAAGMLDSGNTISYAQFIIDNEIIGMVYRILNGIRTNKETVAYDTIKKVAPGGNYVMEDHTVEHMMEEFFYPGLCVRSTFDTWEKTRRPNMVGHAEERVKEILASDRKECLAPELIQEINRVFAELKNVKQSSNEKA
jgi:trimethylamine--corrinoid protein Co-methyltransferase